MKVTPQKRIELLEKLAKAIVKITDCEYHICDPYHLFNWQDTHVLCIEGLYEWTNISMGYSLGGAILGTLSSKMEPEIQAVLDEIKEAGCYLEACTGYAMSLYDI